MLPESREFHEATIASLSEQLGDRYQEYFATGVALDLNSAISLALLHEDEPASAAALPVSLQSLDDFLGLT